VPSDAIATAKNITGSMQLWRIAFAEQVIMYACDAALALIFYAIFKAVDKNLALLAAFFRLGNAFVGGASALANVVPLLVLGGAAYLKSIDPKQLDAAALLSVKLFDYGFDVGLVFFGIHCVVLGYLIYKSGYVPKTLGVLLTIAGLCYLTNSFADFVAPAFAKIIYPAILLPGLPAELGLCLWLIVFGVNVPRWKERALASAEVFHT
jgi:hypothetical protein